MNELVDYRCIDFKKLLFIKGKQLKLKDQEIFVLSLIMFMEDLGICPIVPASISEYCSLKVQEIDNILIHLLDKKVISRCQGKLDLRPLQAMLLNQEMKKEKCVDLISMFENAFGRSLNQPELSIIQSFKTNGFEDKMIMDALNEAVKSGVVNFRYIEKILYNWSKYGVNKRFVTQSNTPQESKVDEAIKDYQWWDHNE